MRPKFCTGIGCVKICQENNNGSDCSKNDFISKMCLSIGQFLNVFQFFIRGSSRLVQEVITACLFQILGQNVTKEGFDPKNNTFVLLLCFVVGATLNKRATMATANGLSMICKFENLANTYLRNFTKFQGNGFFCFGVLRH